MGFDAIANVPRSGYSKDSAKKKKGTRLAKLKQNKRDARREQWVSQDKNKGYKGETNDSCGTPPSIIRKGILGQKTQGNLPTRARGDEHQDILCAFDNEAVPWMSCSIGRKSCRNSLGKKFPGSSSSCSASCSSSFSEDDRESCLDDWEAMADALTADSKKQSSDLVQHTKPESCESQHSPKSVNKIHDMSTLKTESAGILDRRCQGNGRAWSPDDVFRPQNLPTLTKQLSLMQRTETCLYREPPLLLWQGVVSQQSSSCPICCEDFDVTDSSFLPCPCGFQLCLFCHKRILEVDGRCPGCRKQYDLGNSGGKSVLQMSRSCSNNKL